MTTPNGNGTRERLLSQKQVATLLQVSKSAVCAWVKEGKLRYIRLPSGIKRVRESDAIRFLETVIGK